MQRLGHLLRQILERPVLPGSGRSLLPRGLLPRGAFVLRRKPLLPGGDDLLRRGRLLPRGRAQVPGRQQVRPSTSASGPEGSEDFLDAMFVPQAGAPPLP